MKNGINKRIERLEKALNPPQIDFGKIYDVTKEMMRTMGHGDEPEDEFTAMYEAHEGTKEEFIKDRSKFHRQHTLT